MILGLTEISIMLSPVLNKKDHSSNENHFRYNLYFTELLIFHMWQIVYRKKYYFDIITYFWKDNYNSYLIN